ncbi:hypothetical protein PIB30_004001 [Stylosanthes scabra]|uniref:Uncharacterized protein n=1 Tax=Stylosanthes scabra TaxID=79078 RepID=A0ABU6W4V9_9FABA|nr:hypothetical protein [Stylosanthes scabra]
MVKMIFSDEIRSQGDGIGSTTRYSFEDSEISVNPKSPKQRRHHGSTLTPLASFLQLRIQQRDIGLSNEEPSLQLLHIWGRNHELMEFDCEGGDGPRSHCEKLSKGRS